MAITTENTPFTKKKGCYGIVEYNDSRKDQCQGQD